MIKGEISEHQSGAVYSVDDVAPALTASHRKEAPKIVFEGICDLNNGVCVMDNLKMAVDEIPEMDEGDVISVQTPGHSVKSQNGSRFKENTSFTVTAAEKDGIVEKSEGKLRIRYLTPRECLRLQAFPDDAIDRLEKVLSKTAMYKVAGNSIAVCCLKAIFKGIYIDKTFRQTGRQVSLNKWM